MSFVPEAKGRTSDDLRESSIPVKGVCLKPVTEIIENDNN